MKRQIYVDFRFFANAKEVHGYLKRTMNFPDYYGMNLDALFDVLTEPFEDTVITYRTSGKTFERGFIDVFNDAAEENRRLKIEEE